MAVVFVSLAMGAGGARAAGLSFYGTFDNALTPWNLGGGGPQCANYGTISDDQRLRGNLYMDRTTVGQGSTSARFVLPPSQMPNFPLQACELTHPVPLGLGTDDYYGYMFYVPVGWDTGSSAWWGINVAQFHFQNIWAAPLLFELHDTHLTLAIETGACHSYLSNAPGCQYRSNADDNSCHTNSAYTCLPQVEAVPSPMRQGVWHEVIMHVHWASDSSGSVQVWHRIEGQSSWSRTVNLSGFPTVQWDVTTGCCRANATDKVGAYRGYATVPVSVWEDNISVGPDFASIAGTMPMAPGAGQTSARAGIARARRTLGRSLPFRHRCVRAWVRRAWLKRHRRGSAVRRRVLAMRRERHRLPHAHRLSTVYCA
ncbi:MAG TPA: heparin lyase I family protein [Solirubrobacteraceae bacterium]|nr:heparin lyase I family protein [Solirubrobacteraceae bacterium]